jgi:hypothetical protein
VARKQYTNEFSQALSRRYRAQYGYMAATLRLAWDYGEIHLGPGEIIALHSVLERAMSDLLNNVARHGDYFYEMLESKVLAHPNHQQQTYMIDGARYTLIYNKLEDRPWGGAPWELDTYRQDHPVQVVKGPTIEACFTAVNEELNIPIKKLKHLDKWRD